jgi:hypothetical protein
MKKAENSGYGYLHEKVFCENNTLEIVMMEWWTVLYLPA